MLNERDLDLAKLKKVIFNPKYTREQRAKLCRIYAEKYLEEKIDIYEVFSKPDEALNKVPNGRLLS